MKMICRRLTALILALMLISGVFPALADGYYTEISGEDGVFSLSSVVRAVQPADFYVAVDGEWKKIGSVDAVDGEAQVTDPSGYRQKRAYVTVETLENFYGAYGFRASDAVSGTDVKTFAYGDTGIWADTRWNTVGNTCVLPLSNDGWTRTYFIYYLPNNTQTILGGGRDNYRDANSFHTVRLYVANTGEQLEIVVLDGETLKTSRTAEQTMPGADRPVSECSWFMDEDCTVPYDAAEPVTGQLTLYTQGAHLITMQYVDVQTSQPVAGAYLEFFANEGTPVQDVLDRYNIMPVLNVPVNTCIWYSDAACTQVYEPGTAQVDSPMTLYTRLSRLTVSTLQGGESFTVDLAPGTNILEWLEAHADDPACELGGEPLRAYTNWQFTDEAHVEADTTVRGDDVIYARARAAYTITFLEKKDGDRLGSIRVYAGDKVTDDQLRPFENMLTAPDGQAFIRWVTTENVPFMKGTEIHSNLKVYPTFAELVHVNFWHSADATEDAQKYPESLTEHTVGEKVEHWPETAEVEANAPKKGMRFAYWVDRNANMLFREGERVWQPLDLYPVYERTNILFKDTDGNVLLTLHEGDVLDFVPVLSLDEYYAGLRVDGAGQSVIIPNGQAITREWLAEQGIIGGSAADPEDPEGYAYEIIVAPQYKPVRTIHFRPGPDGMFHENVHRDMPTEASARLLGNLDIYSLSSTTGVALQGWTTTPDPPVNADVDTLENYHDAYADLDEAELDALFGDSHDADMYPVWQALDSTICLEFRTNYPEDAVGVDGKPLTDDSYTVYFPADSLPNMPTLLEAGGWQVPANELADGSTRFAFAGWSLDFDGDYTYGDNGSLSGSYSDLKYYGTYLEGAEYPDTSRLNKDGTPNVFYAIWTDEAPDTAGFDANFFIRLDGTLPFEPSQHGSGAYSGMMSGKIIEKMNIANDPVRVAANILTEPSVATVYQMLEANKANVPHWDEIEGDTTGENWYVEWYTCKPSGSSNYHVDGRVRYRNLVELRYHSNGGSVPPLWTQHERNTWPEVNPPQRTVMTRAGYAFAGWNTEQDGSGTAYQDGDTFLITEETNLYAQWTPVPITIPLDTDFGGEKLEAAMVDGELEMSLPTRSYTFIMRLVEFPESMTEEDAGADWTVVRNEDGSIRYFEQRRRNRSESSSFTFTRLNVGNVGQYVFEIWEETGYEAVQYDSSRYVLTVAVVESVLGLGIQGFSLVKDGEIQSMNGSGLGGAAMFRFVNRTDSRDIVATKVWNDDEDRDGLRPQSVTFELLQDGQPTQQAQQANASNGWQVSWNMPIYDPMTGKMHSYKVREEAVDGYVTAVEGNMFTGRYVFTNTHEPEEIDYTIKKVWDDGSGQTIGHDPVDVTLIGLRPSGVTTETTVSLGPENGWTYTFEDLPRYESKAPINYSVREVSVPGYVSAQKKVTDGTAITTTITNTRALTVAKELEGNAIDPDREFSFTLTALDRSGTPVASFPRPPAHAANSDYSVSGGTITFSLRDGETVDILGIPTDGTLTLTETSADGYTARWSGGEGQISADTKSYTVTAEPGMTITVTNCCNVDIPTGVHTDHVPSLLLMGLALIGLTGRRYRRRRV